MSKKLLISIILLFGGKSFAAATYDSTATQKADNAQSIASFDVTIAGTTKIGCMVGLAFSGAVSSISVTVGAATAAAISGSTSTYGGGQNTIVYGAKLGDVTGAKAVVVSWTTMQDARAMVICAAGVDQTTGFNGGNQETTGFSSGTASLTITSASGDLTADFMYDVSGLAVSAPTQTQRQLASFNSCVGGQNCLGASSGPGTANPTHAWTTTVGDGYVHSGANFIQNTAGGATCKVKRLLLGVGGC